MDNDTEIYDISIDCDKSFDRIRKDLTAPSHVVVEVLHQRFQQWISNMGVFARPHLSLDARLVYSESLRNLVVQLLQIAKTNLSRVESLERGSQNDANGETPSSIIDQMSWNPGDGLSSLLVESLQALESAVSGLHRLGAAIRQSSSAINLTQRINAFIQKKDDGTLEDLVYIRLKHKLVDRAKVDEIQNDEIKGAALSLCRQLAVSVSFRYFGILYRRSHEKKVAVKRKNKPERERKEQSSTNATPRSDSLMWKPTQRDQPINNTPTAIPRYMQKPRVEPSDSTPSIPDSKAAKQKYASTQRSFVGTKTIISIQPKDVKYPEPPEIIPPATDAPCPYCCHRFDENKYKTKAWWPGHVEHDLKLYSCISEECHDPPQIFAKFEEWKRHMDEEHTTHWTLEVHRPLSWCCEMDHNEQWFNDEREFGQHVKKCHPEYDKESELADLKELCELRRPRLPYTCPVCNCVPEKLAVIASTQERADLREELLRHIAQHLKEIGFLSIVYLDDDAEDGSRASRNVSGFADVNRDWLPPVKWVEEEWVSDVTETTVYYDPQFIDFTSVPETEPSSYEEDWEYVWQSKQLNAEPISLGQTLRQTLEFAEKWRGVEHPDTRECLKFFASWLLSEGSLEEAEKIYRRRHDLCVKILGDGHADTIASMADLTQAVELQRATIQVDAELAKLPVAYGAEFDSNMNTFKDKCCPGTRTELLGLISEWALSPQGKCIFWLNGMPGVGKSTISRTVAGSFKELKLLGASFFFKRGEAHRGNAKRLFPTIVKQLVTSIPQLVPGVRKAIGDDPNISERSLREQFDKLLLQPLLGVNQDQTAIMVIVLDALDECEQEDDMRVVLQLLPQVLRLNSIHLRFFLTSRPELPIRLGFRDIANEHEDLALNEIPKRVVEHDIFLFLKHRFSDIRQHRSLPLDWPGDDIIQKLTAMSAPLFIFATTMCRFIGDPRGEPQMRLAEILTGQANYATGMDKIYLPVLMQLLDGRGNNESEQLLQEFQEIIGIIILLAAPLSINTLARLLNIPKKIVSNLLNLLQSVLRVPSDPDLPVQILHLSFRDFLLDSGGKFHVNAKETHKKIAIHCLAILRYFLKRNICNLLSYGTPRIEIDIYSVNQCLPPELQYSCRYWAQHLAQSKDPITEMNDAFLFLQEHFLHWVEAMSILGFISEAIMIINTLQSVVQGNKGSEIAEFLYDAERFILKNRQIADIAPLQLYSSGLIFAPRMAIIRTIFEGERPRWICGLPNVEETWGAELQTLEGHSDRVKSVAFSPDGRLLASGSDDRTVKLWDTASGTLQQTLEGHSDWVWSVAFSLDSRLLASGSNDSTVKLWHATIRTLQQTLEGHSNGVRSVAFSLDGRLLVSGSSDRTLKLWDTVTGTLQQTLTGHLDVVQSVAFSPDSRLLASGSNDCTVKLWDTASGTMQHTFKGHSDWIQSVAFSLDGRLLASGSDDRTVKLWDTATGGLQQTLKGHSEWVQSVLFSPDSRLLGSGSNDCTVKLWDTASGTLQQTLKGHSGVVRSVAFSPDSRLLASGSDDHTVKLWDTTTGPFQQTLEGHSDWVRCVLFSPDGRLLASSSVDRTVKLWDTTTGTLQQTLAGHLNVVRSVLFSPDGQLLVSFSNDTAKIWSTATGALQQTLKGYSSVAKSAEFSLDSRLLASGFSNGIVKLWDTVTGTLQQTLKGHSSGVSSVALSQDGWLLASGFSNGTVRLWDTATGGLQQTLKGHSDVVQPVVFSTDGRLLASGSDDRTVKLWDTATGALQQTLTVKGVVTDLKFSKDSSYLSTNLGFLNIQPRYDNDASNSPQTNVEVFIEHRWVAFQGKKVLWLPPEYRPICSAVKDSNLALGHQSGRVSLIGFCTQ